MKQKFDTVSDVRKFCMWIGWRQRLWR